MENKLLTSVFERFRNRLLSFAASITDSGDDAEDALSDAFCKLWRNYRDIEDEEKAGKLSYIAVRHSALDIMRHRNRFESISQETIARKSLTDDDKESEPQTMCEELVRMAEKVLNKSQFEIFSLHDIENLSYKEISLKLDLTEENIRQLLSRARKRIREEYRRKCL